MIAFRFMKEYKVYPSDRDSIFKIEYLYFDNYKTAAQYFTEDCNKKLDEILNDRQALIEFNLFNRETGKKAKELGSNYNDCWNLCKLVFKESDGIEITIYFSVCRINILSEPIKIEQPNIKEDFNELYEEYLDEEKGELYNSRTCWACGGCTHEDVNTCTCGTEREDSLADNGTVTSLDAKLYHGHKFPFSLGLPDTYCPACRSDLPFGCNCTEKEKKEAVEKLKGDLVKELYNIPF